MVKLLVVLLFVNSIVLAQEPQVEFSEISKDLEYSTVSHGGILGHDITLIRSSLNRYDLHVVRSVDFGFTRTTADQACKAAKAHVCINSSFFDERGLPLGLLVSRGITLQKTQLGGNVLTGVIGLTRDGPFVAGRNDIPTGGMIEAVQSGPRLLIKGSPAEGVHEFESTRQSGICIDDQKRILFYVVRSSLFALSVKGLLSVLQQPGVNCREVINLDGGGSSQLYVSENLVGNKKELSQISAPGKDSVPVFLALLPKS